MTKQDFIDKVSKIHETGEDEFRAEYNSPELIWRILPSEAEFKYLKVLRELIRDKAEQNIIEQLWKGLEPDEEVINQDSYSDELADAQLQIVTEMVEDIKDDVLTEYAETLTDSQRKTINDKWEEI